MGNHKQFSEVLILFFMTKYKSITRGNSFWVEVNCIFHNQIPQKKKGRGGGGGGGVDALDEGVQHT